MSAQTATELHDLQKYRETPPADVHISPARPTADSTSGVEEAAAAVPAVATTTTGIHPKSRAVLIITQACGQSFFSSYCNGIVVVALPAMQAELRLDESLLVWPSSSYFLVAGSCLLLAGSIADVAGVKKVNLAGSSLSALAAVACGLARSSGQIIAFRAAQGLAYAIITPSSIALISNSVEEGRPRNIGFACMGFSQPIGFCFGLILGGVFTDTVGWRPAFYLAAAASSTLFLASIWALRQEPRFDSFPFIWKRLIQDIDVIGIVLASIGLASISYVLASLSADVGSIHDPATIVLIVISGLSVPCFVAWMHRQEKNNRNALIPNSLWRSHVFTSCCIMVLLTNGLVNCMELYSSLFFQQVQGLSAVRASLQVVPSLVAGALTSITTGFFVHRMPVLWMLLAASVMSTVAPLLMAVVQIDQLYWENAFFAQILAPISCDILFTIGLLIISDVFPKQMQGLSSAVFNTCAQLGSAIGLSVAQLIAASVTNGSTFLDKSSPDALMKGYRVAFWTMFGWMAFVCLVCIMGMRRVGVIGVKRD
ncbi:hypothetical protein PFICI_10849 [Pestalotiopsis fici W106-1]|uniref:Major facilitator superfamily (MFS) profile domain-containing protein n=1 Tax=Pestalotiopsis fici (strain W106-1 / CGMCC3.15140) TaxID=1229662 RepID=W3WSY7_PESFW|nr:uncharacterized protein PFICI_10849 [Pestalotiopsis fici W106-1]ETS76975.1 hypothetical protein PFICI_10849 [Pestalotiopsis fici W106-1]